MTSRKFLLRVLLGMYPPGWRHEYGAELEELLARTALSLGAVTDVAWGGLVQRVRDTRLAARRGRAVALFAAALLATCAAWSASTEWTALLIALNCLSWGVFVSLLRLGRWSRSGFLVGLFHMIVATPLVLGPARALMGGPFHFQVGLISASGTAAFVPATCLLVWLLLSAWMAVSGMHGRPLLPVAVGDGLMAANLLVTILLAAASGELGRGRIQAGEFFTITGVTLVTLTLIFGIVMPFIASCSWAVCHIRTGGFSQAGMCRSV